ncbi:hypothetical protein PENANT_c008G03841 [Penicillium antarcticum]|uniref:rRNA biogenesis protein RRP36 n=1 Tax=Penicillium antarcticum TaxID=416450 RepID=A0A1V6QA49_9EURO|nr:uncharacterized protein N7508_007025 [Penicillium antarcticum]KAJ5302162.1 hypothetical protein N7508_007025 [Penicillium antarcticum]OQD86110.1 hypothetical protein PENANT_c008G03841 [Penicillium antarcticum]
MAVSDMLNRRVRARPDEEEDYSEASDSDDDVSQQGIGPDSDDIQSEGSDESEDEGKNTPDSDSESDNEEPVSDEASDSDNGEDFKSSLANISFGALAKAQASMSKNKRKDRQSSNQEPTENATNTLDDIRAKLREARELKASAQTRKEKEREAKEKKRASKHAPMEQSSKRAVTRRLTVIEPGNAPKARDPRFDAAVMGHSGAGKHPSGGKAYAFLDEYRASELKELKTQLSKTKNEEQKEALKRQIRSAQDRMRAAANKKRETDVQAEHKKREKQMIREGKKATPYYLKNSELKKQVLEKKFGEMGSRERGKALERRRRKMASKERKEMPWERRGFGEEDGMPNGGKRRRLE